MAPGFPVFLHDLQTNQQTVVAALKMFEDTAVAVAILNTVSDAGLQYSDRERIMACPNSVINLLTPWHQLHKNSNLATISHRTHCTKCKSRRPM